LLKESGQHEDRPVRRLEFLKDVFICSLGAYGGPETHISVLMDHLVVRRGYLSRHDLIELVALCSILPGPTSTQTIVSIGHRLGGPWLGLWAMLVWAVPALMAMTALSFLYRFWAAREVSMDALRYVGPIAIGFILVAAVRIGRTVVTDRPTALLMLLGAAATYVVRSPWIFPLVLLAGGAFSMMHYREPGMWNRVRLRPPWRYLALFVGLAVGLLAAAQFTPYRLVTLFECFYRYGYLVFGGGQVIVPVMHSELVEVRQYLTNPEFLTGYGLVQGLPGPMFSFAAYAGGMAARGGSVGRQLLGALAGGVGIFLPGLLLIYFVYPVWERLKQIRAIRISLRGINAVAGGLIAIAAVILLQAIELRPDTLAVMALSVIFLASRRIPAPVIVAAGLLAGWLF
jgi:chromate transporter